MLAPGAREVRGYIPGGTVWEHVWTGARHDTKLSNGDTALHLAVRAGKPETVKALVDRGADYSVQNDAGHDALYEAVTGRKSHCVLLLMQAGADYQDYVTSVSRSFPPSACDVYDDADARAARAGQDERGGR